MNANRGIAKETARLNRELKDSGKERWELEQAEIRGTEADAS